MIIAKVTGTIVTTISHPAFKNRRLLVVTPLGMEGDKPDDDFVALDNSQAGIGDTVLIDMEGGGIRAAMGDPDAPVMSLIVGIIDSVYIDHNF